MRSTRSNLTAGSEKLMADRRVSPWAKKKKKLAFRNLIFFFIIIFIIIIVSPSPFLPAHIPSYINQYRLLLLLPVYTINVYCRCITLHSQTNSVNNRYPYREHRRTRNSHRITWTIIYRRSSIYPFVNNLSDYAKNLDKKFLPPHKNLS